MLTKLIEDEVISDQQPEFPPGMTGYTPEQAMKQFSLTLDWLNFMLVYTLACYEAISVDTRLVKFYVGIHPSVL